ncbi:peptidylprolyl isomerase [Actinosynnema sp. NPDC050436]|uniref:peptidylprolyl isomerase n=1 Tax=Actinosynnema sp. NPDC050436 TaxID=3155659 RepID=UPI0033D2054A
MARPLLPGLVLVLLSSACVSTVPGSPAADRPPVETVQCQYPRDPNTAVPNRTTPPAEYDVPVEGRTVVDVKIRKGEIEITLDAASAPCSVHNLRHLAKQRFYDGTKCHRLTTADYWLLQCGDPAGDGTGGPGYRFADPRAKPGTYARGTVALANRGTPDSQGSQFFIVYKDSPIPPTYPVVGRVTRGMDVIDEIASNGVEMLFTPDRKAVIQTDGRPLLKVEIFSFAVG